MALCALALLTLPIATVAAPAALLPAPIAVEAPPRDSF